MQTSRYKSFIVDGTCKMVPFIKVPHNSTDIYTYYEVGRTKLDLLSYQYYGTPNYGWLILRANPQYNSLEFKLEDGIKLRIPYPLENAILGYESEIKKYEKINGI